MPTYWFDVFTPETWEEAGANGFRVSGFSQSKYSTVKRVQPNDVLVCYLKGAMRLVGALRVTGDSYLSSETRIWKSQPFPARLPVEPIVILDSDQAVDFVALLPDMSFYDPDNLRRTWARLQGSPTRLADEDGERLLEAIREAAAAYDTHDEMIDTTQPQDAIDDEAQEKPSQPLLVLSDPLEALTRELVDAQRDAARPMRFEHSVADAFSFLGLDVQRQGQAGATDVVVNSRLGLERFRAVVDTKASHAGKVIESHINWAAVVDHRLKAQADYAMIVGERFAEGNLLKFAAEYAVALVDVSSLVEILRLHSRTPFAAADLRPLFATPGIAPSVVDDLRQKSETTERHWQLVAEVIRLVDSFSRSDPPVTPTLGHLYGALLGAHLVERDLDRRGQPLPSEQDVRDAVGFLSSRTVGILRPVEPAETAGYRLTMSPHSALQRLQALQDTIRRFSVVTEPASGTEALRSNPEG